MPAKTQPSDTADTGVTPIRSRKEHQSYGVYISPMNWAYAAMFLNYDPVKFQMVQDPRDAHILVWTGGADVDPKLYNEPVHATTYIEPKRDAVDLELWDIAADDQLKIGICRGAQFLNVMCGGSMYQDVGGHRRPHQLWCHLTEALVEVTSTHHQQMIPNADREDCVLVAEAHCSAHRARGRDAYQFKVDSENNINPDYNPADPEVVWYEDDLALCFQPHPEIGHKETHDYFFVLLESILGGEYPVPDLTNTTPVES